MMLIIMLRMIIFLYHLSRSAFSLTLFGFDLVLFPLLSSVPCVPFLLDLFCMRFCFHLFSSALSVVSTNQLPPAMHVSSFCSFVLSLWVCYCCHAYRNSLVMSCYVSFCFEVIPCCSLIFFFCQGVWTFVAMVAKG